MLRYSLLSVVATSLLAMGCNKSGDGQPAAATSGGPAAITQTPPSDPAARMAFDFLSAVQKGDEAQISACLTQLAAQQLQQRDQRFPVSGMGSVTLQFGEVRKPAENQALVQCLLTDLTKGKDAQSEEICCLLKLENNQWRVSGLAISSPDGRPQILNFEAPPLEAMGPPTTSEVPASTAGPGSAGRPSPPRTATDNFSPATIR
jgi:hypothetical protein